MLDSFDLKFLTIPFPTHKHLRQRYIVTLRCVYKTQGDLFEELWYLVTQTGYAYQYPEVFGEKVGSSLANAMDIARGGQFIEIPAQYPELAWYTYDDPSCDYGCMNTEYMYWGMTSILGAQENREDEISHEWKLNTKDLVQNTDPAIYDLLTDPQYNFPTVLPDGSYNFTG